MFKTILALFVELAQKLLIIYFMNVLILTSFGKISKIFGLHFLVNKNLDYLRFQVYRTINRAKINLSMSDIKV